jgi:uncharacterized protein
MRKATTETANQGPEPASPCISVCVMDDAQGVCRGCRRTLDEIARWSSYSRAEKLAVLEKVAQRNAQARAGLV